MAVSFSSDLEFSFGEINIFVKNIVLLNDVQEEDFEFVILVVEFK